LPCNKAVGPTFAAELKAAGLLGVALSWNETGVRYNKTITPTQRAAVEAVLQAHDPMVPGINRKAARAQQITDARTISDLKTILLEVLG
jgi:hypothetical protein